ncbi:MAG: peptidoglycan/LPS O-acetylase OafA/YrhL [Candidatus Deianiraeaceae bacterium]|jgi:peptidoglycan/LPS O-acetylase OafA/YrhL
MSRILFLDGLRGIAAIIVVLCHILPRFKLHTINGYFGVDIFAIISGFVVYYNFYNNKNKQSILHYTVVRFLRIYALLVPFALIYIITWLVISDTFLYREIEHLLLFSRGGTNFQF